MGKECDTFYSRSFDLLSKKRDLPKSITMSWIGTKMCFGLLKPSLLYLLALLALKQCAERL